MDVVTKVKELFAKKDRPSAFLARQLVMLNTELSKLVETYLYDNEGRKQKLDGFPMMRQIYDNRPQRLLLKCSRKTLKSTLLSNAIAIDLVRYSNYKMLYIAPQETSTKYFSGHYLAVRLDSPPLKKILQGWSKNDIFEKMLKDTGSSILLRYVKEDASRIRGPATDLNIVDEVQDVSFDALPIIRETMSLSRYKREMFAGTPLTTDNTINVIWERSTQYEWFMKCDKCGHWNALIDANEPFEMIQPSGLSCSKCKTVLNSRNGEWISCNPQKNPNMVGYHLAQPILPFFNEKPKEWEDIYAKVHLNDYSEVQIRNEVFGLAFDTGSKPITRQDLIACCQLGEMYMTDPKRKKKVLRLPNERKLRYRYYCLGADWGVNMQTSRTACALVAIRDDGIIEVLYCKIYKDMDYEDHVKDMAKIANDHNAFCASDAGPSPDRGILLIKLTSPQRSQLVRYDHGKFIQHTERPRESIDWRQNRWCLHRSDTMGLVLKMLKQQKILFPRWEDVSECLEDILNIFIEVKDGLYRQELFYRHHPDKPDDFLHALNFAVCQALLIGGDNLLEGPSSSESDPAVNDGMD